MRGNHWNVLPFVCLLSSVWLLLHPLLEAAELWYSSVFCCNVWAHLDVASHREKVSFCCSTNSAGVNHLLSSNMRLGLASADSCVRVFTFFHQVLPSVSTAFRFVLQYLLRFSRIFFDSRPDINFQAGFPCLYNLSSYRWCVSYDCTMVILRQ